MMNIKVGRLVYTLNNIRKECIFDQSFAYDDFDLIFLTSIQNDGQVISVKIVPKSRIEINLLTMDINVSLNDKSTVFINGYQTWTESKEFNIGEKLPKLNILMKPIMNAYGDYAFLPDPKNSLHSWTYTYIKKNDEIILFGSLSEAAGYTSFVYSDNITLKINKDCSGLIIDSEYQAFNIFIIEGEECYAFNQYFEALNLPKSKVVPSTGWTSWYNYYTNITQEIIIENLNAFKSRDIPIDIFQIDDGYEAAVGDWLCINKKFPKGMKYLSDEIKKCGYTSGLWLSPFICEKKSQVYKNHPSWIAKKAGLNLGWSGTFYALDFYNQEVRDYLKVVFNVVLYEWGYDMVKLDFLYAATLTDTQNKTRGQIMYEAMKFLREIAGDKIILGCGVPLGSAFGFVDYCRIGSDISLSWEDKLLKALNCRERVSTISSIISTIGRRHLNGLAFQNDPDVFVLRSTNNGLTKNQRYTLLLVNVIFGGLIFTSDNINKYTNEEMLIYKSIFRVKSRNIEKVESGEVLKIFFTMDKIKYLVLCNLKKEETRFSIQEDTYFSRNYGIIEKDKPIRLQPFESVCLIKARFSEGKLYGEEEANYTFERLKFLC